MDQGSSRRVGLAEVLVVVVAAATVLGGAVDRWTGRVLLGSTWTDRDLLRAATRPWPTSAAELSFGTGARVPGGLLYALLAIPQAVSDRVLDAFRFQTGLALLGTLVVAATAWRLGGLVAAAVAAVVCATASASTTATVVLWNPGLLPLFVAGGTAALVEGVRRRDGRWAAGVALGFGLAAQLHLSAWLVGLAGVAALAGPGIGRRAQGLVGAVGVTLLVFEPYLIDEALHGARNTRMLLGGHHSSLLEGSLALPRPEVLPRVLAVLALPPGGGDAPWAVAAVGLGLAGLVAVAHVVRRGPLARELGTLLALVAVTIAFFVAEGRVELFTVTGRERYFTVAVPAAAVVLGTGAALAVRAVRWRALATVAVASVLAASGVVARQVDDEVARDPLATRAAEARLAEIGAATGWALPEIAGRTFGAIHRGGAVWHLAELPMSWPLHAAGHPPPRALPPPCGLLILGAPPGFPVDEATVDLAYGRALPGRRVLRVVDVERGRLALVDTTDRLCPVNTAQPYVPEPAEVGLAALEEALRPDAPVELPGADGVRRQAAAVDLPFPRSASRIVLATDVDARACPPRVTFTSSRLRGVVWNLGQLQPAVLEDAVLEVRGADGVVAVPLGVSRIGSYGVPTPITVPLPGASGTFDLVLRARSRWAHVDQVDEEAPPVDVVATIFRGASAPACAPVAGRDPEPVAP